MNSNDVSSGASPHEGNGKPESQRDAIDDAGQSELSVPPQESHQAPPQVPLAAPVQRKRRWRIPLMLFVATCFSTFWVGASQWAPAQYLMDWFFGDGMAARRTIVTHWEDGLIYMGCVLAILLCHEMGHFLATVYYRVPASFPIFLPIPINPIGTLGAVIAMDGSRANRPQTFDIGIAGPLAGLVVAFPVLWVGIQQLDLTQPSYGGILLDMPLCAQWMLDYIQPVGYQPGMKISISQLNPYFMAGWIGLLITGLNMMPVSQLDGGHVMYTLFGKTAHWIARGFLAIAIACIVYFVPYMNIWAIMVVLVWLMGTDHPPTRDDAAPIGWTRVVLGCVSLSIPFLCFPPFGLILLQNM